MQNRYPLWKNLMLILIVLIGCMYALPNLYREYPVVQISSEDGVMDTHALSQKVESLLAAAHLPFEKVVVTHEGALVKFKSTDLQLLARDVLKNGLSSTYTVALNLMPSTPKWLSFMHAEPMKQGLDLRGGVHFLLEVDIESVLNRRYEGLVKNIGQLLHEARVRYTTLRYRTGQGVEVQLRDKSAMPKVQTLIQNHESALLMSLSPTKEVLMVSMSPVELNAMRQNTIEQTMSILRKRVNELGVGEAVVQQQGATRIAVDLPGIQDAARAKQILGGTATLQFHLVDEENDPSNVSRTGIVPIGSKLYEMDGHPILLKRQVVLNGDSITSASSMFDAQSATPSVQIQLGGGGEAYFTQVTRDNVGHRMAIVFVETKTTVDTIDGQKKHVTKREERLISAPVIQSALGNNFQITGLTSNQEATNLALLLRAGALPAAIYTVEERTVGPSLGKENIHRGLVSLEVGLGLILILMPLYYRFFGVVANVTLVLNLVLLCALLSMIGATLTLPGIAGIVLTVGMAVDTNVLIYERIREELRHGVSPQAAIFAGYERAFATILDANVTTFIVAVILFSIGTGAIKGFAITLSLGLLTSMMTGVTYTRAIVNAFYGSKAVKKLSIGM